MSFLADRGHGRATTEKLEDALKARHGRRGTVPDSTPTPIKVSVFKQLAIDGFSSEKVFFNAFGRSSHCEKDGACGATHMRYAYEDTNGRTLAAFGRVLLYFICKVGEAGEEEEGGDEGGGNVNGGEQRFHLLACIEDLKHDRPDGYGLARMAAVPAAAAGGRDAPQQIIDAETIEALMRLSIKGRKPSLLPATRAF